MGKRRLTNFTSLESIKAAGITSIGDNGFDGFTNLGDLAIGTNITNTATRIVSNDTILTVSVADKAVNRNLGKVMC